MIDQVTSRYRVLRELGRGGMGVVYVVEHVHTGERLALKVLNSTGASDPEVLARFRREARAGAQIRSEHVVRVTDADVAPELGGAPFFVMELLEGLDFEKLVGRVGRIRSDVVIDLLSQVAKALDKAHVLGIVHRDLKPENLFLHLNDDDTPIAKILDFGISKFLRPAGPEQAGIFTTRDGMLMGTPYYMSPEQARGDIDAIGPATDIWALGLVALRLLTAEEYWTARTQADLLVQLLAAPMPKPSERWPFLGHPFDVWFARSCHRDAGQRWNTASEQIAALDGALEGRTTTNAASASAVLELLGQVTGRNAVSNLGRARAGKAAAEAPRTATITAVPAAPANLPTSTLTAETSAQTNLVHTAREEIRGRGGRTWAKVGAAAAVAALAAALVGQWVVREAGSNDSVKSATSVMTTANTAGGGAAPQPVLVPAAATPAALAQPEARQEIPVPQERPRAPTPRPASSARTPPRNAPRVPAATPSPSAQPAPPPVRTAAPNDDDIMRP